MKHIVTYFFITINTLLCMSLSTQCMHHNSYIGDIDKLMIMQGISKKGASHLEQAINKHTETSYLGNLGFFIPMYKPFIITYICRKNDNSELSKKAFPLIEQKTKFNTKNPCNQIDAKNCQSNYIDECTRWHRTMENPDTIILNSLFFDAPALITALKLVDSQ